jgi:hypothetical protein
VGARARLIVRKSRTSKRPQETIIPRPRLCAVSTLCERGNQRRLETLVLRETAGLGGNVNYVNYGADTIIRRAGTNHLTPLGELRIPLSMIYSADGFGQRTITLKNAVSFTDDRGNATMIGVNASVVSHEIAPQ